MAELASTDLVRAAPKTVVVATGAYEHGREIPRRYGCQGRDERPDYAFSGVPDGTRALAILLEDPDAPGGTFTHWSVWDLPPSVDRIPEGSAVAHLGGREGTNDFGNPGYGGPCPPPGPAHRYYLRVFALRETLGLPAGALPPAVRRAMEGRIVAWGEHLGVYRRA